MNALTNYVLIADDDPDIATIIKRIVQMMGLTPVVASDGAQAVAVARTLGTRLVCAICDTIMPVMNGLDAIIAIRAFNPDVPLILMSASNHKALAQQAALIPHVTFMKKPFSLDYLQSFLKQAILKKELQE